MRAPSRNKWCANRYANDQALMTNDELNPNDEIRMGSVRFEPAAQGICSNPINQSFVIRASSFLRRSSFTIRH
jgi:hypothetical protein